MTEVEKDILVDVQQKLDRILNILEEKENPKYKEADILTQFIINLSANVLYSIMDESRLNDMREQFKTIFK